MPDYKLDFQNAAWTQVSPVVRIKAFECGDKTIRLAEFTSEFKENDWCKKAHTGYVLEGALEIDFGAEKILFGQGDGIFIPQNTKHKARHLTEKVLLFLVEENYS